MHPVAANLTPGIEAPQQLAAGYPRSVRKKLFIFARIPRGKPRRMRSLTDSGWGMTGSDIRKSSIILPIRFYQLKKSSVVYQSIPLPVQVKNRPCLISQDPADDFNAAVLQVAVGFRENRPLVESQAGGVFPARPAYDAVHAAP